MNALELFRRLRKELINDGVADIGPAIETLVKEYRKI